MFEILTEKLTKAIRVLSNKGKLNEHDIENALREIRIALLEADVNYKVVKSFLANIREKALSVSVLDSLNAVQQIVKIVNEELIEILGSSQSRIEMASKPPTVIMLVGLQGAGKTTTAAKLAQYFKQSRARSLLVAADTRRPAAVNQLVVSGKQLDIPVHQEDIKVSPLSICINAIGKAKEMAYSVVIIDTQGRLHIDAEMMKELVMLKTQIQPKELLLVVDAMTGQDAINIAEEFNSKIGLTGLILTKMDGDARGGAALSIKSITNLPIKFVGTGEKASAIEPFFPDRLASRILGMGDMLSLIEKAEKAFDQQRIQEVEKKIRKAEFNLEDFLWQINQIKKMGSLNQIMEMIPGLTRLSKSIPDGSEEAQVKKIEAIIQSMTLEERQNPQIINGHRRRRIAMGSGTSAHDINRLLNQFYQMQKLTKIMSKGKIPASLRGLLK